MLRDVVVLDRPLAAPLPSNWRPGPKDRPAARRRAAFPCGARIAVRAPVLKMRTGIAGSSSHGDLFARQARRHLQLPLGNQQLAMVVKSIPRRFSSVIPIKTGLDQTIEVPHGLDID